jgi:hypothetical protein
MEHQVLICMIGYRSGLSPAATGFRLMVPACIMSGCSIQASEYVVRCGQLDSGRLRVTLRRGAKGEEETWTEECDTVLTAVGR